MNKMSHSHEQPTEANGMIKMFARKLRGFEEVSEEFKKQKTETQLPVRGSVGSAGYDFFAKETVTIYPGQSHLFWTDVKAYMRMGEVLKVYVRSSIGIKKNLRLKNGTGIIDSDYYSNPSNDGNIAIPLHNFGEVPVTIEAGERIAQGIFELYLEADGDQTVATRSGGIGSTN